MPAMYYPDSIRNQHAASPAPRYLPCVRQGRAWAEWQDEEADWEEGWVACYSCDFVSNALPSDFVYASEAEALAAAVAAVARWGYTTDQAAARDAAETQAAERCAASLARGELRRTLRPLVERWGIAELAALLGVKKNHVGNLAKFVQGRKPDVPGESLELIAAAAGDLAD